jgi:hypothetical protein
MWREPNANTYQAQDGITALMFAAQNGHDECMRLLMTGKDDSKIAKNKVCSRTFRLICIIQMQALFVFIFFISDYLSA